MGRASTATACARLELSIFTPCRPTMPPTTCSHTPNTFPAATRAYTHHQGAQGQGWEEDEERQEGEEEQENK